jgi:hypothetical protein
MAADSGGADLAREKLGQTRCCMVEVEDKVGEALVGGIDKRRPELVGIDNGGEVVCSYSLEEEEGERGVPGTRRG